MDTIKFGRTGLEVSRICLGCMTYGEPERGGHAWTLPEADSRPFIRKALDLGINFFDTANVYSDGTSEEIVGRALKDFVPREEVVIATKVHGRMRQGPNGAGLSRKAILAEIDASLQRLGTDYVDLYQIHRWDYGTPIEETLEALNDVVRAGKARYIGASSMYAWQFAKALALSEQHGWARFVSMQNYVNLLYREEEREMLPLCRDAGIARDAVEPAGARPAHPRLGRDERPGGAGRVREDALCQDGRRRSAGGRGGCEGRFRPRHSPRAGRARLAAAEARDHRADRRRHQALAPRGCGGCAVGEALGRGDRRSWRRPTCRTRSSASAEALARSAACVAVKEELR